MVSFPHLPPKVVDGFFPQPGRRLPFWPEIDRNAYETKDSLHSRPGSALTGLAAGRPSGRLGQILAGNEGNPLIHKHFLRSWAKMRAGGRAGGKKTPTTFGGRWGKKTLAPFWPGCFFLSRGKKHAQMDPRARAPPGTRGKRHLNGSGPHGGALTPLGTLLKKWSRALGHRLEPEKTVI